jgi:hypothetical protein
MPLIVPPLIATAPLLRTAIEPRPRVLLTPLAVEPETDGSRQGLVNGAELTTPEALA